MREEEVCWADAGAIVAAVQSGEISAADVVGAILERIKGLDDVLRTFVTVSGQEALAAARAADAQRPRGGLLGPLDGVPVSIKDIIPTAGIRTTAGSRLQETSVPEVDAIVVSRLKTAGAIIIGKTATPEYCHKTVTESPLTGRTRNPWDLNRTPGGSSGGSAAAIAAGMGPVSIGTDGGGSIRLPAALCGVAGLKPTSGMVPQWPATPGWDLLGQTGPLARSVADLQLIMQVIAGPDTRDPDSLFEAGKLRRGRPRVAWARSLDDLEPEPEVAQALGAAVAAARRSSDRLEEVVLNWSDPDQQFRVIVCSDLAAAHGHWLASERDRAVMDPTLVQMLEFGRTLTGMDLARALRWRRTFAARVLTWFQDYDLLLVPTAPVSAFALGSLGPRIISGRKTSPYAWFNWTWPFNVTGQPALSLPVHSDSELPVGVQIIGRRREDALVMSFARQLEKRLRSDARPRIAPVPVA